MVCLGKQTYFFFLFQAEALRFGENIDDDEVEADVGEEEGFCYSDNRRMSIEVGVTGSLVSCSDALQLVYSNVQTV